MWLLKKFRNTDIVGKIYILIILFIVIVTIITCIVRTNKAKETNNINENAVQETNGNIEENQKEETKADMDVNQTTNPSEQIKEEIIQNVKQEIKQSIVQEVKQEEKTTTPVKTTNSNTNSNNNIEKPKEEVKAEKTIENNADTNSNNNQEINTPVEEKPIQVQTGAKYVVNNEMINKMKTYIENNPSEDMQNYGFNVVVSDSSIKSLTNRFYIYRKKGKLFNIIEMWNYKNICRRLLLQR